MLTIEQLKARKRGIGGSDAAAVCGVSKWKTPLDVYGDKTSNEIVQIDNPIFERGHILEPLILALFERETGKQVKFQPQTLKHNNYQFMIANIDGYLPDEKALFEAKTSSCYAKAEWGDVMSDQVPDDYFVQCQHYMAVTETLSTYIGVLLESPQTLSTLAAFVKKCGVQAVLDEHVDINIRIYKVQRDDDFIRRMIKIEGDFWVGNVVMGVAPDYSKQHDLKTLFPSAKLGKQVMAPQEAYTLLTQREEVKEKANALEQQITDLDAQLMSLMGDAEALIDIEGRRLVSWKNTVRKMFDTTKFKTEMPDLYHQFSKTSTSRTFRI